MNQTTPHYRQENEMKNNEHDPGTRSLLFEYRRTKQELLTCFTEHYPAARHKYY